MTVANSVRTAGPFVGNGVLTALPFTFRVFAASDLVVVRQLVATGVETTLTLTTDYTVTLNADQNASPGGTVTLVAPLATGYKAALTTELAPTQLAQVTNAGGFFPAVFNNVFDKLTILVQQLTSKLDRTFRASLVSSVTDFSVPVLADGILRWNGAGTQLITQALPDLSLSLALPSQTGNSGKFLTTNGTSPSWGDTPTAVPTSRSITGGGLATGGGTLAADRVVTVTAASVADIWAGTETGKAVIPSILSAAQAFQTLTYAASIAWDTNTQGFNGKVTLTGSGATVAAPTNLKDGWIYCLSVIQDATGGRTIGTWNAVFDWGIYSPPTLSTGAGKHDLFVFIYENSKLNLLNFRKAG